MTEAAAKRAQARPVVLASASPRRRELLRQIGIEAVVHRVDLDETARPGETPRQTVARLALAKARAARAGVGAEPVVVAADTLLACSGRAIGKPAGPDDAVATLLHLAGGWHEVLSAVAVFGSRESLRISGSRVLFRDISEAEARAYWRTGEPRDKAGGYAVQGLAAIFIERLEGSYSGVMGLPLFETAAMLAEAGIDVLETGNGG